VNPRPNNAVQVINLGLIDYQEAWDYQTRLFEQTLKIKTENRNRPDEAQYPTPNYLLFCQHPHVFTLGKSGDPANLLMAPQDLHRIGASYYAINRGGDITYHGPGQLVVYPVIDLENFFTDIHRYMRQLEEAVILTLAEFGLAAGRIPGLTGVWLGEGAHARKICALGVKTSRWVTMHGLAFNVEVNLDYFRYIVPCGIADKGVTSLHQELSHPVEFKHVQDRVESHLLRLFEMERVDAQREPALG
jgi:lipoyl(octanoyl) transferase